MIERYKQLADALYETTRAHWLALNELAEPSGEEYKTSAYIVQHLRAAGVDCWVAPGTTSVIARVEGKNPASKTIGMKCDIDALPYPDGYRHCCFHSGHSAILLSAVNMLQQTKSDLNGTVYAIFQSSEEIFPSGARVLVESGAFEKLGIQYLFALHSSPELPAGVVAFRSGPAMASTDKIYIDIKAGGNKGNHISRPQDAMNPISVAASVLTELQKINTQFADPTLPTLLNWAKIESNHSKDANVNMVPSECHIAGNFRTFNQAWRNDAKARIQTICAGVEKMYEGWGVAVTPTIIEGIPAVINDPLLTEQLRAGAVDYLGQDKVLEALIRMGGDDFSYYTDMTPTPGCLFRLGTGLASGASYGLHHPEFITTVDPQSLRIGSGLMAGLAALIC